MSDEKQVGRFDCSGSAAEDHPDVPDRNGLELAADLDSCLAEFVQRAVQGRTQMALAVSMLTGLSLTTAALILLSGLSIKPMRPTELAAFVGIRPATLTRQLKELEAKGLIDRTADGDDGRAHILKLTELGNDVLGAVTEMKRSALRGVLEETSYEDVQKIIRALERLGAEVFTTWDTVTHPRRNLKITDA